MQTARLGLGLGTLARAVLLLAALAAPAFSQTNSDWDPDNDTGDGTNGLGDSHDWEDSGTVRWTAGIPNTNNFRARFSSQRDSDDDDALMTGNVTIGELVTPDADYDGNLIISGTLTVQDGPNLNGDVTWNNGGDNDNNGSRIQILGTGTLRIDGNLTYVVVATTVRAIDNQGLIIFTRTAGTQTWTATGTQSFGRVLHSGAGTLQLAASSNVTLSSMHVNGGGVLDLNSRTLTQSGVAAVGSGLVVSNGTLANLGAATDFQLNGTATWSGASVATFGDVAIGATGVVTLGSNVSCSTLAIATGGQLNLNGFTLTVTGTLDLDGSLTVAGGALDVNGTVLDSSGTLTLGSGTASFAGGTVDFDNASFSLPANTGTVTFDGGVTQALRLKATGLNFNDVQVTGTSTVLQPQGATFTVGGGLSVFAAGQVDLNTDNRALVVTGALSLGDPTTAGTLTLDVLGATLNSISFGAGGGTLDCTAGPVSVTGNLNGTNGTLSNPGAFTFSQASGTQTITLSANVDTFLGVTISRGADAPGATTVLAGGGQTLTCTSLSINRGDLDVGACTLDVNGPILIGDGTGTANTATLTNRAGGIFAGGALTRTAADGDFVPAAGTLTFDGAGGAWTSTADDNFGDVVVSVAVTIPASSTVSLNTLAVSAASLTLNATATLEVEGTAANPVDPLTGTLSGGTIVYRTISAGNVTIATTNATYTNLAIAGALETYVTSGALVVGGTLAVRDGTLAPGAGNNLDVTGLITIGDGVGGTGALQNDTGGINAGGGLTRDGTDGDYIPNGGTLTFDGAGTWTTGAVDDFGTVVITGGVTVTLGSDVDLGSLTLQGASTLDLNNGSARDADCTSLTVTSGTLDATGGATLHVAGSYTFTAGSITNATGLTTTLDGAGTLTDTAGISLGNVVVAADVTLAAAGPAVFADLSVTGAGNTLTASSANLTVRGNISLVASGFATSGTTTLTLDGPAGTQTFAPGTGNPLQNLIVGNTSAHTVQVTGALTVNGTTTINGPTPVATLQLDAATNLFSGSVLVNGTIDIRQNTSFDGQLTVDGSLVSTATNGITIRFDTDTTADINGTFNVDSPGATDIGLASISPPTRWAVDFTGATQTMNDVFVQDSDASAGPRGQPGASSTSNGNNINWNFPAVWRAVAVDGNWNNPSNWQDGPPQSDQVATFNVPTNFPPTTLGGIATIGGIDVSGTWNQAIGIDTNLTLNAGPNSNGGIVVTGPNVATGASVSLTGATTVLTLEGAITHGDPNLTYELGTGRITMAPADGGTGDVVATAALVMNGSAGSSLRFVEVGTSLLTLVPSSDLNTLLEVGFATATTVDASGSTTTILVDALTVASAATFDTDGGATDPSTTIAGDANLAGAWTVGTPTNVVVGGNWDSSGAGVVNFGGGTCQFNGTGTITAAATDIFRAVVINGARSLAATTTFNLDGTFSVASGSFDLNGQTMTVGGAGPSTFTTAGGPVTDSGTGTLTLEPGTGPDALGGANSVTVGNLIIGGGTATGRVQNATTGAASITVKNDFTINADRRFDNNSRSVLLQGSDGSPLALLAGTSLLQDTGGAGLVTFTGVSGGGTSVPGGTNVTYSRLTFSPATTASYSLASATTTVGDQLTVGANASLATGGNALDVNGATTTPAINLAGVLTNGTNGITVSGGLTVASTGDYVPNGGVLTFDGAGTWTDNKTVDDDFGQVIVTAAVALGSDVDVTNATNTLRINSGGALNLAGFNLDVNGTLTLGAVGNGNITATAGTPTMNVSGNYVVQNASTITTPGNLTTTLDGDLSVNDAAGINLGNLVVSAGNTVSLLTSALTCTDLTVNGVFNTTNLGLTVTDDVLCFSAGAQFVGGNSTVQVAGDWISVGSGTVTFGVGGLLRFNGTAQQNLEVGGPGADQFRSIEMTNTSAAGVVQLGTSGPFDVDGNLTITQGLFTLGGGSGGADIEGTVTVGAGANTARWELNGTTVTVGGGTNASCTTFNATSTITDAGNALLTLEPAAAAPGDPFGGVGAVTVGRLVIGGGVATGQTDIQAGAALVTVKNELTVNTGRVLSNASTLQLDGTDGTPLDVQGALLAGGSSTIRFTGNAAATTSIPGDAGASINYNNVEVTGAETYVLAGPETFGGTLQVAAGSELATGGNLLNVNGQVTLLTGTPGGRLTNGAGGLNIGSAAAGGFILQSGAIYTPNGGTLTFDGPGSWQDSNAVANNFGAVVVNMAASATTLANATRIQVASLDLQNGTITVSGPAQPLDVNGAFTIGDGNATVTATLTNGLGGVQAQNGLTINVGGIYTPGANTLTFDGTGTITDNNAQNLGAVVITAPAGTLTSGSSIRTNTLTMNSGDLSMGHPLDSNGQVTVGNGVGGVGQTSTLSFTAATTFNCFGVTVNATDGTYTNGGASLTMDGAGSWGGASAFGVVSTSAAITVTTNVSASSLTTTAGSLDLNTNNASVTLTVGDLVLATGTLNADPTASTFTLNSAGTQLINAGANSLGNLTVTNNTTVQVGTSACTVAGATQVGAGSSLFVLNTAGAGAVFAGDVTLATGASLLDLNEDTTFNGDLTVGDGATFRALGDAITIQFSEDSLNDMVRVLGTINMNGAGANSITLKSFVNGNDWELDLTGFDAQTFVDVSVRDSDADPTDGAEPTAVATGASQDLSGNDNWSGLGAAIFVWQGDLGGGNGDDWDNAGNWNLNQVPVAGSTVRFDSTSNGNSAPDDGVSPASIGNLIIDPSYTLAAPLLTADMLITGSLTVGDTNGFNINTRLVTVGGDVSLSDGGDINATSGTLRMNRSGSVAQLAAGAGSTINAIFQVGDLGANGVVGGVGLDADSLTTVRAAAGSVTIQAGALLVVEGSTYDGGTNDIDLTVTGATTITGGMTAGDTTVTAGAAFDSSGVGVVTFGTGGLLRLTPAADVTLSVGASDSFRAVTVDTTNAADTITQTGGGLWAINGLLSVLDGELAVGAAGLDCDAGITIGDGAGVVSVLINGAGGIAVSGAVTLDAADEYTPNAGLLTFGGAGGTWTDNKAGGDDWGSVRIDAAPVSLATGVDVTALDIRNGGSLQLAGNNLDLNGGGTFSLGVTGAGTLSASSASTMNVNGSWTLGAGAAVPNPTNLSTTFDTGAGTLTDNTLGGLNAGSITIANGITLDLAAAVRLIVQDLTQGGATADLDTNDEALRVLGNATLPGVVDANSSAVEARGDWSSVGAGTVTFNGTGSLTFNGSVLQNLNVNTADAYLGVVVNNTAGVTQNAASGVWTINGTLQVQNGALTLGGAANAADIAGLVTIGDGAAPAASLVNGGTGITAAAGLTVATDGGYTPNGQLLTFDGAGTLTDGALAIDFGRVQIAGATLTLGSDVSFTGATALLITGAGVLDLNNGTARTADINGAFTITSGSVDATGGGALTVAGNLTLTTGTITTPASLALTFDGSGTWTNDTGAAVDFGAVTVAAGVTTTLAAGTTGSFAVRALNVAATATLDTGAGDEGLTINGGAVVSGAFTADASAVSISGSWDSSGAGAVSFTAAGNLTFNGTLAVQDFTAGAGDVFGDLTQSGTIGARLLSAITAAGNVSVTAASLNLNGQTLDVQDATDGADCTTNGGTIVDPAGNGTLILRGAGTDTLGGTSAVTVGNLQIESGTLQTAVGSALITVQQNLTINGGSLDNRSTLGIRLNGTDGTPLQGAGNLLDGGAAPGTGTITYAGDAAAGTTIFTGANVSYANLVCNVTDPAGETFTMGAETVSNAFTIGLADSVTLAGNLDVNGLISGAGTLNAAGASNVNVAGGLTITTYTAGSGTLTFDGAGAWSNGGGSFGTVVVSAAVSLGTDVTVGSLNVTAGALSATTFTLTCGGSLTVTGNGFTTTTGGVTFSGAATWTGAAVTSFGDVTVNPSVTVTTAGATIRTRGLVLGASSSLVATASDLFVAGGLSAGAAGCTFTNAGRTLTFNGGAAQTWNPGASSTINNLATTGAGTAVTINLSPVTVGGTTNVGASSTLTVNASTCVFTGATTVNGTLAHSGNASYLADVDVNNGASFTAGSVTLRFAIGVTLRTNAAGATINCTGTSLRLVGTDSPDVPANRWLVFLTAAETFSGVVVQNSDGQAPGAPVAATASSGSDLGNNVDWFGLASVDLRWTGASGGGTNNQWDNAGNWSPALVPFAGCSVVFDGATPGYVVGTGPTVWVGTEVTSFQNFTSIGNSLAGATLFNGTVRLGASATTSFSGTFSHQAGAFDVNNRTLRLDGAATTINLPLANAAVVQFGGGGAQSLSSTLNPLTVTDLRVGVSTAANVTVLTTNPIRVNGAFTVEATATFNTGASDVDLDLNGSATIAGALMADTSQVTCAGSWDSTGAGVVSFAAGGLLTFDGAAAQTVSLGATDVLQGVATSNGAGVTQGATSAAWDVNGSLSVTAGSLTLAATGGADIEGTVAVTGGGAAGGLDINGATVTVGGGVNAGFTTSGGRVTDTAGTGTVTLEPGAAADSLGGAFSITVGNLTIGGPTLNGRSSLQAAAADVTVLVTLTVNTSRVLRGGSSTGALRTSAWTLTGTYEDGTQATFVAGNLTVTGTWTENPTGTLTFNRPTAGTQTLSAGGASLGNARVNNGVTGVVATVQLAQPVTFTALDLNGDDVMNPNGQVLTISGNGTATPLTVAAAANLASGVGAGTVRFTSTVNVTLPAITFRDLTLDSAVTYSTSSTALTVNGALTLNVAGATLAANHNLTAGSITGPGTLAIGAAVPVTLTTGTIAGTVTVTGASGTTITFQTPVTIPNLTYGSLTLNGGAFTVTGGALSVQGTLTFQGGASVVAATTITFSGAGPSTLQAGTAPQNFAGLTLNKAAAGTTLTLTAVGGAIRQISGTVNITQGTLSVAASWQFNEDTIVGQAGAGTQGSLRMQTTGVNLQLGDGAALPDTVTVHDSMLIGSGSTPSLRLTLGNQMRIQLQSASSVLAFAGDPGDPNKLQITTTSGVGFIDALSGGTITAANVAVAFNNAANVTGGITATASEDGTLGSGTGTNTNWFFQGGGALLLSSATALGDGTGRINRVRMTFTRQLNTSTLGTNFSAFGLKLGTGTPVVGTAINLVTTSTNDTVDVTFGAGVSTTSTENLSLVYTAPASGRITSFDGISANQNITLDGTTTTPRLFDGAAPTLALVATQDLDANGGLDRIVFEFSEPVGFSGRTGVSLSGFDPVTSTASLPIGAELTLRIAGETLTPIPVDGAGPQTSGANVAARIQSAVRDYLLTSAATLNKPAIQNFTCTFTDGRYVLSAGVPVRFVGGTYISDYTASTVEVVVGGANDASALLKLGVPNGGTERPGAGNADPGVAVSSGTGSYGPSTATLSIGQDGFTDFTVTASGLVGVANDLQSLVRAKTARSPACQPAYDNFCAVADTGAGRLILVPGTTGSGSGVVVDSLSTFATTAIIGSASIPSGAIERTGTFNTTVSIDDLMLRSSTGANLMLGRTPANVTVSGSQVVIDLPNAAGTGTGSPAYLWKDLGDGGFLTDRAHLVIASAGLTNLNTTSNVVIVGDTDGDRQLLVSQGQGVDPGTPTVDASATVAYLGTAGVTTQYSWAFVSGPATPLSVTTTGPVLQFQARTAGIYRFRLTIQTLDAAGQPAQSPLTDNLGRQVVLVDVEIKALSPVASAGPDQVLVGTVVQLDGSGSFDPNGGSSIAYEWSGFTASGVQLPSSVFSDAAAVQPTFTPTSTGTFTIRLTVRKSPSGLSASDDMLATVIDSANLLPVADGGPDLVGRVNTEVTLDGSRSCDPEGAPLTFTWSILSSPQPSTLTGSTTAQPRFVPSVPGSYVLQLVVSDGTVNSLTDTVTVIVIDDATTTPRRAPGAVARAAGLRRAAFLATPPADLRNATIALVLPDGTQRAVTIKDVAGDATDDPTASATAGLTQVRLVSGLTVLGEVYAQLLTGDDDPVSVVVDSTTQPILSFGVAGEPFTLDGTRSQDDGLIQTFTWTWVSGPSQPFTSRDGSLLAVTPLTGAYVFDLVVTDAIGLSSLPARIVIPVVPASQPEAAPPTPMLTVTSGGTAVASPGTDLEPLVVSVDTNGSGAAPLQTGPATLSPPRVVVLSASTTVYRGGATAGTFTWAQLAGPQAILSGQTTDTLSVTMKIEGAYAFGIQVTDSDGVTNFAIAWIVVGADPPIARLTTGRRVQAGTTITLDGSGSTGPSGLTYQWSQLEGAPVVLTAQQSSATTTLDIPGTYRFSLRVSSGGVTSAPATVKVRADGTPDQQLATGATTSKSSGGCALTPLDPPDSRSGAALGIVILALLAARRRGRRAE